MGDRGRALSTKIYNKPYDLGIGWQVGRRLTRVTILTGSIVRVWGTLETVLERYQLGLSRSDRTMRVVRADFGAFGSIIGAPTSSPPSAKLIIVEGSTLVTSRFTTLVALMACRSLPPI